jgi:hypothetical protein
MSDFCVCADKRREARRQVCMRWSRTGHCVPDRNIPKSPRKLRTADPGGHRGRNGGSDRGVHGGSDRGDRGWTGGHGGLASASGLAPTGVRTFSARSLELQHPRSLVQIGGPQPLAGKQVTRLPLRGNGLSHSSPDRAFVAPNGWDPAVLARASPGHVEPLHQAQGRPSPVSRLPIQPRPLLATPSAASYSRPLSTAKGARRHGPSAIGGRRSRGRVQAPQDRP